MEDEKTRTPARACSARSKRVRAGRGAALENPAAPPRHQGAEAGRGNRQEAARASSRPTRSGVTKNEWRVFVWQFGGELSKPIGNGVWRCFRLDELEQLQLRDGEWRHGSYTGRHGANTCIDRIRFRRRDRARNPGGLITNARTASSRARWRRRARAPRGGSPRRSSGRTARSRAPSRLRRAARARAPRERAAP